MGPQEAICEDCIIGCIRDATPGRARVLPVRARIRTTWRVVSEVTAVMVAHHVIHAMVGTVQLVMGRGDRRFRHRCQRRHRAGRIEHIDAIHRMVHLQVCGGKESNCR